MAEAETKMMVIPTSRGTKIGERLVWIDLNLCKINDHEGCVVITARTHNCGGQVLGREIATREHAERLRDIANTIDAYLTNAKRVEGSS